MNSIIKQNETPLVYANIQQRFSIPISFVKGAKSNKIIRTGRLIEVFQQMKEDEALKTYSSRLEQLKNDNNPGYSILKEKQCPGFIVGSYTKRNDDNCKEYIPLIGFDIDKAEDFREVKFTIADCKNNPYVFAAFPSPSKRGVRVLMWCDSTKETHKGYYAKACAYLSKQLRIPTSKQITADKKKEGWSQKEVKEYLSKNIHIDQGTSNISRIWFYTHNLEEDIYLNTESDVFKVDYLEDDKRPPSPLKVFSERKVLSLEGKFQAIEKMTDQRFNGSGRNDRMLLLSCLLFEHGVTKLEIANYCLRYAEKDFDTNEIEKIINNAEAAVSKKGNRNKYTDEQLYNYSANIVADNFDAVDNQNMINDFDPENHFINNDEINREGEKPKITKIKERLFEKYDIRLNTIAIELEYKKKESKNWIQLNENDLIVELLEAGFKGVEGPLVALLRSSRVPKFDPIDDYFSNLPQWDESHPDYILELSKYVDAKDNDWFRVQFKKMLVRLIACAINLIPFNKHAFTLVGKQNDGKTTFIRFLCPRVLKNYFKENIDIHNKDGRLALCQNIIINLDELANFSRYDINKTKAFLTIDKVKERLPYDRKSTSFERRASFFASTNSSEFLTDETGNVRWLIFEINSILHDNGGGKGYVKNIDIDNVYGQALYLLKNGFEYKLTKADISKSESNNKQYQVISLEEELIQECFAPGESIPECEFLTTSEIQREIELLTKATISNKRIGKALRFLGFNQTQKYFPDQKYQKKGYWVKKLKKSF